MKSLMNCLEPFEKYVEECNCILESEIDRLISKSNDMKIERKFLHVNEYLLRKIIGPYTIQTILFDVKLHDKFKIKNPALNIIEYAKSKGFIITNLLNLYIISITHKKS